METIAQQERCVLEISPLRLKSESQARTRKGLFTKERENKIIEQKNNFAQYALKVNTNVPNMCKDIIRIIEDNVKESTHISPPLNLNSDELINKKNYIGTKNRWLDKDAACPLKNGLYYISDGKNVAVCFFDKEKRAFSMLKELNFLYWSTKPVTLLR